MQFLCLLIFIGATQCDGSTVIAPNCYDNLGVPNAVEYVSEYSLSVQTSYITSVECMLSSNHYIQSGFSEIDSSSNDILTNLVTSFKNGFGSIENMINGFQQTNEEKESQEKINAVVSMTVNYYQKKDVTVQKSETKLSEVTEVQQAQSILTARRCESSYTNFMNDVTTIKKQYTGQTTTSTDSINSNQWATLVKQYYDARENIVTKTNVYSSIREAFLFGSGINLCDASANTDQSLLEIYKTDDLSKFFGKSDNNASALLCQTVTQMYKIYKSSLTTIYLKSVVHSKSDLAMRVTIWEQVNLVRANFEYMSQNIVLFIKTTQTDAESTFGANSEQYKKITLALYTCVKRMLLTVVKSTEVHYKRALNFNPDRSMIKTDYNKYKVDIIETYNENIMWSSTNAVQYDMRLIEKEDCSYPSTQTCLPKDTYSLLINKLVFQTFICQVNFVYIRIKTTRYDKKDVDSWINDKITLIEFHNSIIFSKYSATINKMFIINSATYSYILLTTEKNIQSNDVQQIMDQTSCDVVGVLSVNTLEITETYKTVDIFLDTSCNTNTQPIVYKPETPKPSNTPSPSGGLPPTGSYSPQPGGPPPSYSPQPGGPPPSYSPQPGGPPPSNSPQPGGPPPSNSPQPGGPPPSNSPQPGGPPPSYSPQPGGPPPSYSPQPGGPPPSYSPQPGGPPPSYSPQPGGPPPSYSPQPGGPPPSYSPQPGGPPPSYSPQPGGPSGSYPTGSYNPQPGNSTSDTSSVDYKYSYIKSGKQIVKTVQLLQISFKNKITSSVTNIQITGETEYSKVVIQSLQICERISQYNTEYLDIITSDSVKYISGVTTVGSQDYFKALIVIFRDTQEKSNILSSSMDIPFRRATIMYSLTSAEYVYVNQTIEYTEFVTKFYKYFNVNCDEIYNSQNDAELFLTNSVTHFNKIYSMVVTAVQKTPDNAYKTFQLCYLEKTIAVYKQTTDCFREQIVQSKQFISKSGEGSKIALYQEIKQRVDSINVMYAGALIKSYQYSKNPSCVTIFESEYDIISSQTEVVSYSRTVVFEIGVQIGG